MVDIEAVKGGQASCYLSKRQMSELLQEAHERGVVPGQILKEAVVRMLVGLGRLRERDLEMVIAKQEILRDDPLTQTRGAAAHRLAREVDQGKAEKAALSAAERIAARKRRLSR